ncbi:MAG: filamentous hemagglutinin N-terminal domain-containing protein [Verrucomicrobia bacterium]|nr:filamentous hemagglutinin N-terminal domain-containing protein [Verrucomicrobiota bacterium]
MNNKSNNNFSLRKLILTALIAGPMATLPAPLWALPWTSSTNLTTTSGVTSTQAGTTLSFTAPDKAVLSWVHFGDGFTDATFTSASPISAGDTINYILPSTSSSVLNLVTGSVASTIGGSLTSNGNIYVLNANGVILSSTAQVNAGGFYVSTIAEPLASAGFQLNGTLSFVGTSTAAVTVNGGNYQAVGSGNNIVLYGRNIDVNTGNFYGNLTVNATGGAGQNATFAQTGAVSVNQVGVPATAGALSVKSNGGNIVLSGVGTGATFSTAPLVVGGSTSLNTAAGQIAVNAGGSGYAANSNIDVTFAAAPSGGINATGYASTNANGVVTGVTVTNAGVGYTAAPAVSLAPSQNNTLTVQGGMTLNTVGAAATGSVLQTAASYTPANSTTAQSITSRVNSSTTSTGSGTTTSINAGTTGTITLPVVDFSTLTIPSAGATDIADNTGGLILGNINITPTSTTAGTAMTNLTLRTTNGEISMASGAAVTVNATTAAPNPSISLSSRNSIGFTGSGALTFASVSAATTATLSTTGDVNFVSSTGVLADGATNATSIGVNNLSITTTGGKITANNITGSSTQSLTASGDILARNITSATSLVLRSTGGKITTGALASTTTSSITAVGDISIGTYTTTNGAVTFSSTAGKITTGNFIQTTASSILASAVGDVTIGTITQNTGALTLTSSTGTVTTGAITTNTTATLTINTSTDVTLAGGTVPVLVVNSSAGKISQGGAITSTSKATFNALNDITLTNTANNFNVVVLQGGGAGTGGISVTDTNDITVGGGTNTKGATTITAGAGVTALATSSTTIPVTIASPNLTATGTVAFNQTSGIVSSITIGNGGSGYAANANNIAVTIPAPTKVDAVLGTATLSGTSVNSVPITTAGNGYTPNTQVALTVTNAPGDTGTGFAAVANINSVGRVGSIRITNMGTGYAAVPTVAVPAAPALTTALGVANTDASGRITSVTITEPGSGYYATTAPAITFAAPATVTTAANATGNTNAAGALTSITVNTSGATAATGGYFSAAPVITLTNGATATAAVLNGVITSITPLHSGGITLGTTATDSLVFGNSLTLASQGPAGTATLNSRAYSEISTVANSILVSGNVQLNTGGANANLGTNSLGAAANYSFGAISATTNGGNVNLIESLTLNLGAITTTGTVTANSTRGNIVNSGVLTIGGALNLYANSLFTPGDVTLSNTGNNITGNIVIQNAKNVTVVNPTPATTNLVAGSTTVVGKADLSANVTGKAINLTAAAGSGGDYSTVGFNATGNVTITDPNSITIANATNSGAGTVTVNAAGTISLGSGIALTSTGVSTFNATGSTGTITDIAPNISIVGPAAFVSDTSISITKSGHSIGPVSLTSGATGVGNAGTGASGVGSNVDITYTEAGTANLNVVNVNQKNVNTATGGPLAGNLTVVSTSGGIKQTATTGVISVPFTAGTGANSASFTAATGSGVVLDNTGTGANAIIAPATIRATTDSSIINGNVAGANITLNGVTVTGGAFTADAKALAGGTITERSGSTIFVYGASSFQTNAGKITLDQTGNNFGALSLKSDNTTLTGADIAVTEGGTLNLAGVNTGTAGALTVTSETGGIIQTGNTGVTVGAGKTATLSAGPAGITLNSGNNFGGSALKIVTSGNTGQGNVTLQDSNANTVLASDTKITGTLTIRNTANGTLKDISGGITVGGNVLFDVGTGSIQIVGSGNSFGAIQFRGGNVSIAENQDMNLNAGSVASGQVSLSTLQNFSTSGLGTSTFAGTTAPSLTVSAGGGITITNPIFVANGLTFRALGAVDLSTLSLIGNLNGIAPTNLGASSYKAPGP